VTERQRMDEGRLDLSVVRVHRQEITQALLGETILLTDEQWGMPSRLPGWTRAHIASHLARNADGLTRVVQQLLDGTPTSLYADEASARSDIERGSERTALELQVDLDASANRLHEHFEELLQMPPDRLVALTPTVTVRLDHLPIVRINELVLHHIDLDIGYTHQNVDPQAAAWLLAYNAARIGRNSAYPAIRLMSDSGVETIIGGPGRPQVVHGPDSLLLAWLTRRLDDGTDNNLPELANTQLLPALA